MAEDYLISIDLDVFVKSINECMKNLKELERQCESEAKELTYQSATKIEEYAKEICRKKTGTLARSIHCSAPSNSHTKDESAAKTMDLSILLKTKVDRIFNSFITQVGTWLSYSYWVERGSSKWSGSPYLLPAFETKFNSSVDFFCNGIKKILDRFNR